MRITRSGSTPSATGPADWFTGTVRIDAPFHADAPARVGGATVTFEPGARTAWHTHPLGQTLFVTFGLGWAQREGGPIEEIRPGDVVWFEPGEKHWHGASATTAMQHVAIAGGPAPVRAYIAELLADVLEGRIQPGRVFDRVTDLDGVPDGYRAMNDREAIKIMITF